MAAGQVEERVLAAHRDVKEIIGTNAGGLRRATADAMARLSALEVPDVRDSKTWGSFKVLATDLRVLLCVMQEAELPSSDPPRFRALIIDVLLYLHLVERTDLGLTLAGDVYYDWLDDLGPAHADSVAAGERYAMFVQAYGFPETAHPIFVDVLDARIRILGREHAATLETEARLCECLLQLEDYAAAARISEENVRRCGRALGPDSDVTLRATTTFAELQLALGRTSVALAALRDVDARFRRTRGPDDHMTLRAAEKLAGTLHTLGAPGEAEVINLDLMERYKAQDFDGSDQGASRAYHAMRDNLEAMGRSYWDEETAAGRSSLGRSADEKGE